MNKGLLFTFLIFTASCYKITTPIPPDIKAIIDSSQLNGQKLDRVIAHYQENVKDSLKLKAAFFLIRNMSNLQSLDTISVAGNAIYFDGLSKLDENMKGKPDAESVYRILDSINNTNPNLPQTNNPNYILDLQNISSEFLIKNIDDAFANWQNKPWSNSVNFANFCEYILPYRCMDTYSESGTTYLRNKYQAILDSAKKNSLKTFNIAGIVDKDINNWFNEGPQISKRYPYLVPMKFSDLLKGKTGDCYAKSGLIVTALRSLGIPAAFDRIPNWANSNSSHYWFKVIDPKNDTNKSLITNDQIPNKSTQFLITGSSYDFPVTLENIPKGVHVYYGRTVPKVYRMGFEINKSSLQYIKNANDQIPPFFQDERLKDVSNEYLSCGTISVTLKNLVKPEKFLYLYVYDPDKQWLPVAWTTILHNEAKFINLGKNILYLPSYCKNGNPVPAGPAIILRSNGTIHKLNPNEKIKRNITLYSKVPYKSYVRFWASLLIGGKFLFANKRDLSDSVTVSTIKSTPYFTENIKIANARKYRYLFYKFKGKMNSLIAEMSFYGRDLHGKEVQLKGKLIGNKGNYGQTRDKLMDDDRVTYFSANDTGRNYVGIDLGAGNATRISRISYLPWNDDNAIAPNDLYELFYWKDNDWVTLGKKHGNESKKITFQNVPSNCLFLLKDLSRGSELRPFIYERDNQVFW